MGIQDQRSAIGDFRLSRTRSFFSTAQLGGEGIMCSAGAENPADHDTDDQHTRNEDQVRRRHVAHQRRPLPGGFGLPCSRRRETSASSRST